MEKESSKRFTPAVYIKTSAGSLLAALKVLEAIAIVIIILWFFKSGLGTGKVYLNIAKSFQALEAYEKTSDVSSVLVSELHAFQFIEWISLAGLILMLLECIGVVLLRVTGRFSGLVRFIHTLIYIGMLLGLIAAVAGWATMISSISKSGINMRMYSGGLLIALSSFGLLGLGVNFFYHRKICSIMKTIGWERKNGKKRSLKRKNTLPRYCGYLVFLFTLDAVAVLSALLMPYLKGVLPNVVVSTINGFVEWFGVGYTNNLILNLIIVLFFIAKYVLVGSCANHYNKVHGKKEAIA